MTKPKGSKAARNARRLMSALFINGVAIAVVAIGIIPIVVDQARSDETVWSWNPLSWVADDFANLKILILTCAFALLLHLYARSVVAKMED
jgi:hypothetical protein